MGADGIKIADWNQGITVPVPVCEPIMGAEDGILGKADENLSDSALATRAAGGDEEAFEEILRRYSPRVFRVCGRFFLKHSLVEDAAQETFLRAFTHLRNFEGRGSLEGWLTRIASTTCINILRSQKRSPSLTMSDLTERESEWLESNLTLRASASVRNDEQRLVAADLVQRVIGTLLPDDAMVLVMMECEGASIKEAAELTGWTESKVKVRAFRARRKMRDAVEKLLRR